MFSCPQWVPPGESSRRDAFGVKFNSGQEMFSTPTGFLHSVSCEVRYHDMALPCSAGKLAGSIKKFNTGNFKCHFEGSVTLIMKEEFLRKEINMELKEGRLRKKKKRKKKPCNKPHCTIIW